MTLLSFSFTGCLSLACRIALVLCLLPLSSGVVRADNVTDGVYQQERARCLDGRSHQDRTTCLREAAAAHRELRKGGMPERNNYAENARQRCMILPQADRDDCMRRMQGDGFVSGGVEQGGVYRETRTITIGEPVPETVPASDPHPVPTSPSTR